MVTPGHPGQRRGNLPDPTAPPAGGNRSPAHSLPIPLAGFPPNTTRGGPTVVPTGMHPHPTGGNLLAEPTPTGLIQPLRGVPQPPAVVDTAHTPHTTLQPGKLIQPHQSGPPTVRSITPPHVDSTAGPVAPSHLLGNLNLTVGWGAVVDLLLAPTMVPLMALTRVPALGTLLVTLVLHQVPHQDHHLDHLPHSGSTGPSPPRPGRGSPTPLPSPPFAMRQSTMCGGNPLVLSCRPKA